MPRTIPHKPSTDPHHPPDEGSYEGSYEGSRTFTARLAGQEVRYQSKPGLPHWDRLSPAETLLAEHVSLPPGTRLLGLGIGHSAAAVPLARQVQSGEVWLQETSYIALQMSAATLELNDLKNVRLPSPFHPFPLPGEDCEHFYGDDFDAAVMALPKGRRLAQRWLCEAHAGLRSGGALYLAGPNDLGIQTAARDAENLFGPASVLNYKHGNRLVRLIKQTQPPPTPAWARAPGIAPCTWQEVKVTLPNGEAKLRSLPGVFSKEGVDEGTRLLLDHLELPPGARLLDPGCGIGVIGLWAAQKGAAAVDLVDVNLMAVAAARENLQLCGVGNGRVLPSDALSAVLDQRYSVIAANPPFHTGKAVDYTVMEAFIRQGWQVLEPGGQFWWVANRFINYADAFQNRFSQVRRVAETNRFHVWAAVK